MDTPTRTVDRARDLRSSMSLPEVLLWRELRRKRFENLRFRRQHPVGPYVLDFYCERARLAVEIDGAMHFVDGRPERDAARDQWLKNAGIFTLRLPARLVLKEMNAALDSILHEAEARPRRELPPQNEGR